MTQTGTQPGLSLYVRDFRRIVEADLIATHPVSVVVGNNGQGKSSLLGAFTVALTGTHPEWLVRRGESLSDLRRAGAKSAGLELTLADVIDGGAPGEWRDLRVVRGIGTKAQELAVTVEGLEPFTGVENGQAAILKALGCTREQLRCALSGGAFLDLDANRQAGFLASLSGSELDAGELQERIDSENHLASRLLGDLPANLTGVDLLDAVLKMTTEGRRDEKRERDRLRAVLQTTEAAEPPLPGGDRPEDCQARYDALSARVDATNAAAGRIAQADEAVSGAREQVAAAEGRLAALQTNPQPELDVEVAALEAKVGEYTKALAAAQEEHVRAQEVHRAVGLHAAAAHAAFAAIRGAVSPTCPTCKQAVNNWEGLLKTAQASVDQVEAKCTIALADEDAAGSRRNTARDALVQPQAALKSAKRLVADRDKALEVETAAVTFSTEALVEATAARAALPAPEDTAAIQVEINALDAWVDWVHWEGRVAEQTQAVAVSEAIVQDWEWLVSRFGAGPESYRMEWLSDLGPLEAAVNAALQPLTGYTVVFPAGEVGLSVQAPGVTFPATRQFLSGSEWLRLRIALQYAFCRFLEFPLLVMDCEAALDPHTRAAVLSLCKSLAQSWTDLNIIVAMAPTRSDWRETLDHEAFAGWADVWEVSEGRLELAEPGVPAEAFDLPEGDSGSVVHTTDAEPRWDAVPRC